MPYESHRSRQAKREREALRGRTLPQTATMTASEVRGKLIEATDNLNAFIEKNKDTYMKYKEEFDKLRRYVRDPYLKKQAIEDLTLSKFPKLFATCVELYSQHYYWQEMAVRYRVDDAVVLALPDDVPNWLSFLQGSEHKYHPNYEPVRGKVFLPSHLQKR